ncbi:MAG: acyltransferase [Gammaproteobacteria bacterium]|nr:acyltransferase [Gammaproteobacteria bacterium]
MPAADSAPSGKNYFAFKEHLKGVFFGSQERFAPIDGMRAITMLNVVLFHCLFGYTKIYDEEKNRLFVEGLPSYLNWVWQVRGSDCLFLVSGFLMGITLIREYQKTSSIDVMRFYKRRVMRIYPLFLVALAIYTMTDFERNIQYIWSNLLFITNFSAEYRNIVPVGWSLAVQMQFYLIVPFIVMMIFATRHRLLLFVLLFIAVVILRYVIVFTHPELNDTTQYSFYLGTATTRLQADLLYYNLHTRFGPFALGLIVAYIGLTKGAEITAMTERFPLINIVAYGLGFGLMYWASYIAIHMPSDPYYQDLSELRNLNYIASNKNLFITGFAIATFFAIYGSKALNPIKWFVSRKFWYPIAQLILPIYFFHFIFIVLSAVLLFQTTDEEMVPVVGEYYLFALFFLTVFFTFIFSVIFHVFIEQPFIKMRN